MFWCMCICEYKTFILCNRICGWPCFCYFWECCLHPFAFLKFFFFSFGRVLGLRFLSFGGYLRYLSQSLFCWRFTLQFLPPDFFLKDQTWVLLNIWVWCENLLYTWSYYFQHLLIWKWFFFFLLNPVVFWWWQSRGGGGVHQVMLKWWWWSDEKVEEIFIILFWNLYMYGYIRTWFVLKLNFAVPHLDPYIDN